MALAWEKLVGERNKWVAHNFPKDKPGCINSIFGCIEELGELVHSHLKEDQAIRGAAEEHQANARDAVGDLTVYLLGVMNHYHCIPQDIPFLEGTTADEALLKLAEAVGFMAGDQFSGSPSRHQQTNVSDIVFYLKVYCSERGWDYEDIVLTTWVAVKQRDWILYPDTGLPQAVPSS